MKPEVSCIIPGASKVEQVHSNVVASELDDLSNDLVSEIDQIYDEYIKMHVHQKW